MSERVGAGTAVGQSDLPHVATQCTTRIATQHNMLQHVATQHGISGRSTLALGSRNASSDGDDGKMQQALTCVRAALMTAARQGEAKRAPLRNGLNPFPLRHIPA